MTGLCVDDFEPLLRNVAKPSTEKWKIAFLPLLLQLLKYDLYRIGLCGLRHASSVFRLGHTQSGVTMV